MASTTIISNGSKWAGEEPDSIETLLGVLASETLDPTFEEYGNFAQNEGKGVVRFFGNFFTVSHAFSITSDDEAVCNALVAAIKANQATAAYQNARTERAAERVRRLTRPRAKRA